MTGAADMDAVRVRIANWTGPLVRPASARLTVEHFTHNGIAAEIVAADGRPAATFAPLGMVIAPPAVVARAVAEADAADLEAEARKGITDAGLAAAHAVEQPQCRNLREFLGVMSDPDVTTGGGE